MVVVHNKPISDKDSDKDIEQGHPTTDDDISSGFSSSDDEIQEPQAPEGVMFAPAACCTKRAIGLGVAAIGLGVGVVATTVLCILYCGNSAVSAATVQAEIAHLCDKLQAEKRFDDAWNVRCKQIALERLEARVASAGGAAEWAQMQGEARSQAEKVKAKPALGSFPPMAASAGAQRQEEVLSAPQEIALEIVSASQEAQVKGAAHVSLVKAAAPVSLVKAAQAAQVKAAENLKAAVHLPAWTALHQAASHANIDEVRQLLADGADPAVSACIEHNTSPSGQLCETALDLAIRMEAESLYKGRGVSYDLYLKATEYAKVADLVGPSKATQHAFVDAAKYGNASAVQQMVEHAGPGEYRRQLVRARPRSRDNSGQFRWSALMQAAHNCQFAVAKILVEEGAPLAERADVRQLDVPGPNGLGNAPVGTRWTPWELAKRRCSSSEEFKDATTRNQIKAWLKVPTTNLAGHLARQVRRGHGDHQDESVAVDRPFIGGFKIVDIDNRDPDSIFTQTGFCEGRVTLDDTTTVPKGSVQTELKKGQSYIFCYDNEAEWGKDGMKTIVKKKDRREEIWVSGDEFRGHEFGLGTVPVGHHGSIWPPCGHQG